MILLILEHLILSAVILAVFLLFFRQEHKHQWNRVFLLGGLALSCLLPFLPDVLSMISYGSGVNPIQATIPEIIVGSNGQLVQIREISEKTLIPVWSIWLLGSIVYVAFIGLAYFHLKAQNSQVSEYKNNIYLSDTCLIPYTFFNKIYIPSKHNYSTRELEDVILHERSHVELGHAWDLLLIHSIGIFVWWNPLFYIYKKLIRDIHEYQADARVIRQSDPELYSRFLWQNALKTARVQWAHPFFNKPLKNRIIMIKKSLQSTASEIKYLLILPLCLSLFAMHSCKESITNEDNEVVESSLQEQTQPKVLKVAEVMPRFPGCDDGDVNAQMKCTQMQLTQYVFNKVKYPEKAKEENIAGMVVSKFVVSKDGQVYDIEIVKDPGAGLGDEVLRVLKDMSAELTWDPGMQDGKVVSVEYTLPVKFQI
ncbi:MAG: M56 family metallopeptidase [Saprospiraceae bacterium]|nr:M56 family metallopeptidase [Saprospiraceae bacterium]